MPTLFAPGEAIADARFATREEAVTAAPLKATSCYHCGNANPDPDRWHCELHGALRHFCCAGCLGIARTIHAAGLDAYYEHRASIGTAPQPERAMPDEWTQWDERAAQSGFVRAGDGGAREISLLLEGIHCGACIALIESWLGRQPGVREVNVNFATRRARLVWNPGDARLSDLLRAVATIGYRAYPYDPARREALARRESRALLLRFAVATLAMMQVMMFAVPTYVTIDGVEPAHRLLLEWASLVLSLPALVYSGAPFFRGAWRDVAHLRLGMDVPVALGLSVAFAASVASTISGEGAVYYDSVTMFIALLLAARYLEFVARRRAGDAVESVARARAQTALRLPAWPARRDVETVESASLAAGEFLLAKAGGTLAADGQIVEGSAHVEESMLTGESRPRLMHVGDAVRAGSLIRDGALVVRVTAAGEATRLAAIERLAERAGFERPRIARVADRVATWFVATLLVLAACTALAWWLIDPARALAVTFAVLVVSCPCALSLATPAALAAAAGALSRCGVVMARADALESLARVTHVVVDKTGTLTTGRIVLRDILPEGDTTPAEALALAAALEAHSEHPVARAFRDRNVGDAPLPRVDDYGIVPGKGVEGIVEGRRIRLGNAEFVAALSGACPRREAPCIDDAAMRIELGDGSGVLARFVLEDEPRPGAALLVRRLKRLGIETMLLSGDRATTVAAVAASLKIAEARGDAQPEDKRDAIAQLQARGANVAMVGDGINDAPSLAQAQVSVSLGSATPLAQWTADVVVLGDELPRIADAIVHARRTLRVVRANLGWAFAYNAVAIPAAAAGYVSPLIAAVGMSVSSLVVVANALTVGRLRKDDTRDA